MNINQTNPNNPETISNSIAAPSQQDSDMTKSIVFRKQKEHQPDGDSTIHNVQDGL